MEKALWYLLAGTRGGENRVHIIRSLSERSRNADQLAGEFDLDHDAVRHHLNVLIDHDVVKKGDTEYASLYFLTDRFEDSRVAFEHITEEGEVR